MKKYIFGILFVLMTHFSLSAGDNTAGLNYGNRRALNEFSIGFTANPVSNGYYCSIPYSYHSEGYGMNFSLAMPVNRSIYMGTNFIWSRSRYTEFGYEDIHDTFSVIFYMTFKWINLDFLSLYSRIGVGLSFFNNHFYTNLTGHTSSSSPMAIGYHFSPFGIEIGHSVAFYLETGWGRGGVVDTGIRVRF